MKKLTIRLDDDLHKALKLKCVHEDISINDYVTNIIVESLKEDSSKGDE